MKEDVLSRIDRDMFGHKREDERREMNETSIKDELIGRDGRRRPQRT